jgi:predicted NUDIX family NTP pyrophosphohydrolase
MKQSAGILLYRKGQKNLEVLIVHPGGPYWAKKDAGAWSIPKGEFTEGEDPFVAAKREFSEEIGLPAPEGDYQDLGQAKQSSGKIVYIFVLQADLDIKNFKSNQFEMEWPPRSGQKQSFPEADKAAWVSLAKAKTKLVKGQQIFIDNLAAILDVNVEIEDEPDESGPAQVSLF